MNASHLDAPEGPSDPWFRTRSPEQAMDVRGAAFYPHRLRLLGSSNNFALKQRVSHIGPITVGDTVYETDVAVEFDDDRAHYHVLIPLNGCLESRYRGQPLTSTPTLASIYRPDAEMAATWWPGGSRHLAVKLDQVAVDRALEALVQGRLDSAIEFDPALPLTAGAAQEWVRLLVLVHRQLENPDSMLGNSLVLAPLVESLIHGFLLVANHPYRESLGHPSRTRPTGGCRGRDGAHRGRPAPAADHIATRDAMSRQRAQPAGGVPQAPGHVADGVPARGQAPPCPQ